MPRNYREAIGYCQDLVTPQENQLLSEAPSAALHPPRSRHRRGGGRVHGASSTLRRNPRTIPFEFLMLQKEKNYKGVDFDKNLHII